MLKHNIKVASVVFALFIVLNPFAAHAVTLADLIGIPTAKAEGNAFVGAFPVAKQRDARYTTVRTVTAYSSTPDQTDSTPFTTANGTQVHDGIVAANWLKFGTRIRIPEMFGDKVFIVTDRMHPRFDNRLDIWFEDRADAVQFGLRRLTIEVL